MIHAKKSFGLKGQLYLEWNLRTVVVEYEMTLITAERL